MTQDIVITDKWLCAGCGKPSPGRVRACGCPTSCLYDKDDLKAHATKIESAPSLVERLNARMVVIDDGSDHRGGYYSHEEPDPLCSEAASLITTLRAERDAALTNLQTFGELYDAEDKKAAEEIAGLQALVQSMREAVEQAFKDGLAYGNNVANADPDVAWQQSRVRAALSRSEVG